MCRERLLQMCQQFWVNNSTMTDSVAGEGVRGEIMIEKVESKLQ